MHNNYLLLVYAHIYPPLGPHDTHPPRSVVVPPEPPATIPGGLRCGQVIDAAVNGGTIRSPGFPSHRHNQDCAFVLRAPEGYGIQFRFPNFQLEQRYQSKINNLSTSCLALLQQREFQTCVPFPKCSKLGVSLAYSNSITFRSFKLLYYILVPCFPFSSQCTKDYVQIFSGSSTSNNNLIVYNGYPGGRLCLAEVGRFRFSLFSRAITFLYHTDSSGGARGLEIGYELIGTSCSP